MPPFDPDVEYDRWCEDQAENAAAEQAYLESAGAEAQAQAEYQQEEVNDLPF